MHQGAPLPSEGKATYCPLVEEIIREPRGFPEHITDGVSKGEKL